MTDVSDQDAAVELLQQLGLKEYESRAFVVLSRLPEATAKDISELSDVPRTRVYDAVRVLESKGLVEIQHTNPQRFRAVSGASETLSKEYEQRIESLQSRLSALDAVERDDESDVTHEVWSLSGEEAVSVRTAEMISEAQDEVLLFLGAETALTAELHEALALATQRSVPVKVGTPSDRLRETLADELPETSVFVSDRSVVPPDRPREDDVDITRLLLVDRNELLVSTTADHTETTAVFGRGFNNGLVALVRRLLSAELTAFAD